MALLIQLEHAHQLGILAKRLQHTLQQRQDPFQKATIVVPNRNLQQWLNLQLAKHNQQQVIASIAFEQLEGLLARHFLPPNTALLDADTWRMLIMSQLQTYLRQEDATVAPINAYLRQQTNREKGIFELAGRMVALFREYELSRHQMIQAWHNNAWYVEENHLVERWQRRLWHDLFKPEGQLEQFNAARQARAQSQGLNLQPLAPLNILTYHMPQAPIDDLHLFGQTYIGRFYQMLLKRLSHLTNIHIYALNPCTQFWEDLITDREAKRLRSKPLNDELWARGYLEAQATENPLLRAWGRPGREYFRLLNELAHWDIDPELHNPDERHPSLLQQIQYDTRHRQPLPQKPTHTPDPSLHIIGNASPRREAEAIANHIWNLVQADPTLAFNDIGVIVSDMAGYQGAIESAFKRMQRIPFNLVDGKYGRATRLMEGIAHLLNLADTNREREHFFRLFYHPNFQARFPLADTDWWADQCQRLAIYAGTDANAWQQSNTKYFDGDLYSWQQGVTRAHLGLYLHPKTDGTQQIQDQTYATFAAAPGEREATTFWLNLTRSLIADLEVMSTASLKPSQWATFTTKLCQTYLAPRDQERRDFDAVINRIQKLTSLDDAVDPENGIRFSTFRSFLQRALDQLTAYRGQYLADGVTVSSFLPMRPIPFRVLFICGLDEHRFPAPAQKETLDLRWAKRRVKHSNQTFFAEREIGDLSARERDAYMFLEAVVSAKERLILSYVNRNEATGDPINPSAMLAQLMQWIPAYTGQACQVEEHPLKAYSQQYRFEGHGPMRSHDRAAASLAAAQHSRQQWENALAESSQTAAEITTTLATWPQDVRQGLGLTQYTFEPTQQPDERTLNISHLRKFLESPLQAAVEAHLHMRQQQENDIFNSEPPLKSDNLTHWAVLNDYLSQHFSAAAEDQTQLLETLQQQLQTDIRKGMLPAGPLSAREMQKLQQTIHHWLNASTQLQLTWPPQRATWRLAANDATALQTQALDLQSQQRLFLIGQGLPLFSNPNSTISVHFRTGKNKDQAKQIHSFGLLACALDACVRSAFAQSPPQHIACVFADGSKRLATWQMNQADAKTYLTNLADDWQRFTSPYLLPGDFAFQTWQQPEIDPHDWAANLYDKIQKERTSSQPNTLDQYGPLADWQQFEPPDNLSDILQRRYLPLFRAMQPITQEDV